MIRLARNGNSHNSTGDANGTGRASDVDPEVTIRLLSAADDDALRTLAERDSARPPRGSVIGVEKDGRLLAAISTSSGQVVADPFYRTEELVSLLRVRVGQMLPPLS
jgi:hypothetical protein